MNIFLPIMLLMFIQPLVAQDYPRHEADLQGIIDDSFASQDEDLNYEELYESLIQARSHPKNLNTIDAEGLRELRVLTPLQVQQLLEYRSRVTSFVSIYELQAIPEFDLETVYALAPFVFVPDPTTVISSSLLKRVRSEGDHYLLCRYKHSLQRRSGFDSKDSLRSFLGSPGNICIRFRTSRPGDFSAGFSMEKDEGEQIRWAPRSKQYGFDYNTFHLQLQNKGKIKNLVVGDFQAQFGQGLVFGGGFGMGKGGETVTAIRRSNLGLTPYTSIYEAGAFRGIAGTFLLSPKLSITALVSLNNRDANIADSTAISAFQTSGLHRTKKELSQRHQVKETNAGLVLEYRRGSIESGIIIHYLAYDKPVQRMPTLYNQFAFTGDHSVNTAIFLNYTYNNIAFFTEAARTWHGGRGLIAGVLASLHPTFDISIAARMYQRNYYSIYGSALSENTTAQNEQALYWGWKYRMNRKISAGGYMDIFVFPWIKFRTYRPSRGSEWLFRVDYAPSRKVRLLAQIRQETKSRNNSEETNIYKVTPYQKRSIVMSSDFGIGQKLRLTTRLQHSQFKANNIASNGFALAQDLSFEHGRFELTGRYVQFATDDFDNRQYSYEKDVWLAYSLPAYFGTGVRHCLMVEYKLNRQWTFWLRYTQTRYVDREEIGSGLDTIKGQLTNDLKIQARLKF